MAFTHARSTPAGTGTEWVAIADALGPGFAEGAAAHDADDSFVAENYAALRGARVFSAHVPAELGGGGASHEQICAFLQALAHYCGSTALALSMHTHQVATAVWRWRQEPAPVEPLLRRVAAEELVLVSSGGSDWLPSSGTAVKVEGGYRVSARKIFSSGCPSGDLLITSAVYQDPEAGPTVLHFPLPLRAEGVRILDTWHTMGMRATGSHDVLIENAFIPDSAIAGRRPQGKWHFLFHLTVLLALPIIYAVYVGIAEAARDLAVREATNKRHDPDVPYLVGEMDTWIGRAGAGCSVFGSSCTGAAAAGGHGFGASHQERRFFFLIALSAVSTLRTGPPLNAPQVVTTNRTQSEPQAHGESASTERPTRTASSARA